jgi:glycine cleavage system H protein
VDASGKFGITDHAQNLLTDVVYADLPTVGRVVQKGEHIVSLDSVKATAEVYAPISGTITAVNQALSENSSLLNSAPYGEGWIAIISPSDAGEMASLLDAAGYAASIA